MCLLDFCFKVFLTLFQIAKSKKKKAFNQSTVIGALHEEAKKVEKNKYVAEKIEDVRVQVEL